LYPYSNYFEGQLIFVSQKQTQLVDDSFRSGQYLKKKVDGPATTVNYTKKTDEIKKSGLKEDTRNFDKIRHIIASLISYSLPQAVTVRTK
jgi:hypothetical protein